jgi:Ca2+-binding RTX toxin-like protein
MGRIRRKGFRRTACFAIGTVALLWAPVALAGTASSYEGNAVVYRAAPGEVNDVAVSDLPTDQIRITDSGAPIIPGPGCLSVTPNQVDCTDRAGRLVVDLGDLDDKASIRGVFFAYVRGRDGNDRLHSEEWVISLSGGAGDDVLSGGSGCDNCRNQAFEGGAGNDRLNGGDGSERLIGGPGADILDGGGGYDTADYRTSYLSPLVISLDDQPGDGAVGENDNVGASVEAVQGGWSNDLLIGNGRANKLSGGPGADVLRGGGGDDTLSGAAKRDTLFGDAGNDFLTGGGGSDALGGAAGRDYLSGDDGDDVLKGGSWPDVVLGRGGTDTVDGNSGADRVNGGTGSDRCRGGDGNDWLIARDGTRYVIAGGRGMDRARIDRDRDQVSGVETFAR